MGKSVMIGGRDTETTDVKIPKGETAGSHGTLFYYRVRAPKSGEHPSLRWARTVTAARLHAGFVRAMNAAPQSVRAHITGILAARANFEAYVLGRAALSVAADRLLKDSALLARIGRS